MNLKRLVEISPLIGSFFIFLGFLKLNWFYSHWNITISQYLDFSEIILSFLQDSHIILFFLFIMIMQMTMGFVGIISLDKHIANTNINSTQANNVNPVTENSDATNNTDTSPKFEGILPLLDDVFENRTKIVVGVIFIMTLIFTILFLWKLNLIFLYLTFMTGIQLVTYILGQVLGIKNGKTLLQVTFISMLFAFTFCISRYKIHQAEISQIGRAHV